MTDEQKIEDLFKLGNVELAVLLMINNPVDNLYDLLDLWMPVKERLMMWNGQDAQTKWSYSLNKDWNVVAITIDDMIKFYLIHKDVILFSQIDIGGFNSATKKKYLIKLIKSYIEHEKLG